MWLLSSCSDRDRSPPFQGSRVLRTTSKIRPEPAASQLFPALTLALALALGLPLPCCAHFSATKHAQDSPSQAHLGKPTLNTPLDQSLSLPRAARAGRLQRRARSLQVTYVLRASGSQNSHKSSSSALSTRLSVKSLASTPSMALCPLGKVSHHSRRDSGTDSTGTAH